MHWIRCFHLAIWLACVSACGGSSESSIQGCRDWLKQYEAAQRTAEKCMAGVASNCAVARPVASVDAAGAPYLCKDCQRHVDSSSAGQLDDLLTKYNQGNCSNGYDRSCPECVSASGSVCQASGICG